MKTLSAISLSLALAATSFVGCDKADDTLYDVSFFTSKAQGVHTLYIDDVEKGALEYSSAAPQCGGATSDGAVPLKLQMPSGTYVIKGRDAQGKVTTFAEMTISEKTTRGSGNIGGMSISKHESCVVVGLSE